MDVTFGKKYYMITYHVSYELASSQYIQFKIEIKHTEETIQMALPAWRPGRYELGNFSKNIKFVRAFNELNQPIPVHKIDRNTWSISNTSRGQITIEYEYYAGILNAGSTFLDESQLYMNPVNCLMMIEGFENKEHQLKFKLPSNYIIASGLKQIDAHTLTAPNFDRLADCPLIASCTMKHHNFKVNNLSVHLWFQGESKPDFVKIETDFKRFISEQIEAFGDFPEPEYHFLFQITPHKTHHGVEHENSTVCMIGPTYQLFKDSYDEFLGLSSHEFYHSWNIKKIRPVEMLPYDFSGENYFRTGYVAEGVTTYMGDIMLYRSRVFNQQEFFSCLHDLFKKHFHNYGRFNMPVADASFDMWIDGYETGVPHRKTSIYTEGALIAMYADIEILKYSNGEFRLDHVMHTLYHDYAKKGIGYSEEDYWNLIEKYSGKNWTDFINKYVNGSNDFEPWINKMCNEVGLIFTKTPSKELYERNYGIKLGEESGKITQLAPGSPALLSGLQPGEIIATINGFSVNGNIRQWFDYFKGDVIQLRTKTPDNRVKMVELKPADNNYYPDYTVKINEDATTEMMTLFERWTSNKLF
jgi:predicted metalloprotease with PDZ domain